ncbi:MAG: D-alanyl-D-alanine carboxypeptidase/D-alanyl-D-alanine-endopeptidase [Gemmatimonadetes bacterium]|nr:D-alanyl-D-alanine carboxypeptidase/D-alanyl-D-alanine-endopeptidase [Gemmatimonadota bacterium]
MMALAAGVVVGSACAPGTAGVSTAPAPDGSRVWTRPAFRAAVDSLVQEPKWRNAHLGILVVDPQTGDTLYSHNAGKLFMPASNQKILTSAAVLSALGADYRFSTEFYANGPVTNGVLNGDVVVAGRGDPSVSDAVQGDAMKPLRAAAESLWARGVREITGGVVKAGNAFPDTTIGEWDWDDLDTPSGAAIDELFFNNGIARVRFYGGSAAGEPIRVERFPARTVPNLAIGVNTAEPPAPVVVVDGQVVAAPSGGGGRDGPRNGAVNTFTDIRGSQHVTRVSGWVAPRDSVTTTVTLRDPAGAWLQAFHEALSDRGIIVRAGVTRTPDASLSGLTKLFVMRSPPLREILPFFMKPSQNQIGEMFLRVIALENTGVGSVAAGRRAVEQQLRALGADSTGVVVRDGSGLSRHDYVTPETLVRVLDGMRKRPDFQVYYDAFGIGGVDGTIASRMRGTPAQGNARGKTGTLDKSRALSGYVTTRDGRLLIYSFQANNFTTPNADVERLQDWILVALAGSPYPAR